MGNNSQYDGQSLLDCGGPTPLLTRLPKGSSTALTFSSMTPKSEKQNRSVVLKKNVTNGAEYSGQFDEIKIIKMSLFVQCGFYWQKYLPFLSKFVFAGGGETPI